MNEVQINKIKKRADEYATSCFPYEKQFLEREAVVKCCVHVVTETIAELEKACDETQELLDKQIEATHKLDVENAELDCQKNRNKFCFSCVKATEKCFKNEIGCPCDKYKTWKDENAELTKQLLSVSEQLRLAKEMPYSAVKKFAEEKTQEQLTKAKEIIKGLLSFVDSLGNYSGGIFAKAEQFLNCSEKPNN